LFPKNWIPAFAGMSGLSADVGAGRVPDRWQLFRCCSLDAGLRDLAEESSEVDAMRHFMFPREFIKLWTLLREYVTPERTMLSQESLSNDLGVTRERDREPLRLYPF
jgi:hypothetical protein